MQTYKIINFNKSMGSIVVEFAPDMAPISIDLPIKEDGNYITGEELDQHVQGFIPTWFLERKAKIAAGIPNESEIEALVVRAPAVPEATKENLIAVDTTVDAWSEIEAERQFAKLAIKFGLLQEDPTQIGVTNL